MLTDQQLNDMQTDALAVYTNPRNTDMALAVMARHVVYLLAEVVRLRQWDQDRWLLKKWDETKGSNPNNGF